MGCAIGYKGSSSGIGLHMSFFPQGLDRFPDRSTAHTKLLGQFPFRGKLVTRLHRSLTDRFFDLLNYLLIKPRRADDFVHGTLPHPDEADCDQGPLIALINKSERANDGGR